MKVLHLLATGGVGGIENLMREYALRSDLENYFIVFWGGGANTDAIKANGGNVIELGLSKKKLITTYKELKRLTKSLEADVIVTHHDSPMIWLYMSKLKQSMPHLRTYIYAHSNIKDMHCGQNNKRTLLRKAFLKYAFKYCDSVIAISKSVNDSFLEYGYSQEKIKVIYNGVNCERFSSLELKRENNPVKLVYVGRLIPQKGVDRLIKAVSLLKAKDRVQCDIVGDGPAKDSLMNMASDLKVQDKVVFHGTRRDVDAFLGRASFFIHPAKWEEGFGIAVVEAMSAGVIPIAFNKGAIPEIIDDGVNGFIVYEESESALAAVIDKVVEMSSEELDSMRIKAREKAEMFNMGNYVNALDGYLSAGGR